MSDNWQTEITYGGKTFESIDAAIDWKKRQKADMNNYRRQLRETTRKAIGQARILPRQRILCRARLAACDSENTLDVLEDELQSRGALPLTLNDAPTVNAIDWLEKLKEIIAIIEELFANK